MIRLVHAGRPDERLEWTDQHRDSFYGLGVILRVRGRRVLNGARFKRLTDAGWHIECTTDGECLRVAGALALGVLGIHVVRSPEREDSRACKSF